jgi:hypothetical protein
VRTSAVVDSDVIKLRRDQLKRTLLRATALAMTFGVL